MLLRLPSNLHYPITVTKIEARVGNTVQLNDPLFIYSYISKVIQGSRYGDEEEEVDKRFVAHFESTLEGSIKGWRVWEGDIIDRPVDVCEVEEECAHTVQFSGMCTNCGKDMTDFEPGSGTPNADRARIQALHDTQFLTISQDEANKIDEEAKKRLLSARKLSLVVDLDQTIIHAAVDPTIAEWQKDKDNPNHDALKDVRAFQLIDDGPGMRGCWYYIKLRPGLEDFLDHVSQLYELHIYTMGTRQYAQQIANIVDPERKYFGDRILSRDESGSMVAKNLERLFPVDTKMVVIIDDRGDVWKWSANLIRVTPFDFFVGIGDINSSFLPKKQEIQATPKPEKQDLDTDEGKANGEQKPNPNGAVAEDGTSIIQNGTSALETLIGMSGSDDPTFREMQSKGQEEIIVSQLKDQPLLRMQQEQDERDRAEGVTPSDEILEVAINGESQAAQNTDSDSSSSSESEKSPTPSRVKTRHSILKNDDEELVHLEARLSAVHAAFFSEYDRKRVNTKGGRVAALTGKKKAPLPSNSISDGEAESLAELQTIPDVKKVMPAMKMRVLAGVVIVFSGVLPLGTDIQNADISTWAKTFGAKITDKVTKEVTHVIAARAGTAKVKQAVKRGIKVVGTTWLIESIQRWRKLDERKYFLEGAGKQRYDKEGGSSDIEHETMDAKSHVVSHDFLLSSEEDDSSSGFGDLDGDGLDDFESEDGQPAKKRLKINVDAANAPREKGEEQDEEFVDDGSPITINQDEWDDMDAELKEFMGSEAESESDNDSVSSALSYREKRSRKRHREDDDDGKAGNDATGDSNSRPEKIPRKNGGSALKTVANVESAENTETSTPAEAGDRNEIIRNKPDIVQPLSEHDEAREDESDDELARELEREMEGSPDE